MKLSTKFTMALHLMVAVDYFSNQKITSDFLAGSINTNPVVVRRLLSQLKAANLVEVARGTGGVTITQPLDTITFLDIYKAVEKTELFHFHDNPNRECPVGSHVHDLLDQRLADVQKAMEDKLQTLTLADLTTDLSHMV